MSQFNAKLQHIIVFLLIFSTTFIGYLYTNSDYVASNLWLSTGIALAFFVFYDKKYLVAIILGLLFGRIFARTILSGEEIYLSFIISFLLSLINLLQIYIIKIILINYKKFDTIQFESVVFYPIVTAAVSVLGGMLGSLVIGFIYGFDDFLSTLINWTVGDILGFFIFGNTFILSIYYDKKISYKLLIQGTITTIVFVIVTAILMSGVYSGFRYQEYSYVLMVFFFAVAFYFPYRMIITLSISFVLLSQGAIFGYDVTETIGLNPAVLNIYLLVLVNASIFTRMAAYILRHKNEELIESNAQLERLIDSTNLLFKLNESENLDLDSNIAYIKNIFQIALTLFDNFDIASCYIRVGDTPNFVAAKGYKVDVLNKIEFSDTFDWAVGKPNHVIINDKALNRVHTAEYIKFRSELPELKESIRFGLLIDNEYSGGMSFDITRGSDKQFTQSDYDQFVSFHKLMNSFYEINYFSSKKNNFKNDIVLSLISTLELYDQYTGGHSEQVARIAMKVANKLGLRKQDKNELYWAAVVHDIGKVGIDPSIINKPGRLTDEEYEMVKQHSNNGADILYKSEDLRDIANIVRYHHEWWNGNGYPAGLKGNDIPLQSQILTIADAVSAMSDYRPYSPAMTTEQIIEEVAKHSGVMFNPELSLVMIECLNEGLLDK